MKNNIGTGLAIIVLSLIAIAFTFSPKTDNYIIDPNLSELKWTGYHLVKSYAHNGFIDVKYGTLTLENGDLVSGKVVINMKSITNNDLKDQKDNQKLVKDLKSKRFFNVKEYPEASIAINKVQKTDNNLYSITSDITIRGITRDITFDAQRILLKNNSVEFSANIEIDRTEFNVMYGWSIENVVLSNKFNLQLKLVASKLGPQ